MVATERQRLLAKGRIGPVDASVMHWATMQAEAEVRCHDEFAKILAELPPDEADSSALMVPTAARQWARAAVGYTG